MSVRRAPEAVAQYSGNPPDHIRIQVIGTPPSRCVPAPANACREAGKLARYAARSRSIRADRRSRSIAVMRGDYAGPAGRQEGARRRRVPPGTVADIRSTCSYPGKRDEHGYGSKNAASRKHFVTIRNRGRPGSAVELAVVHGQPVLGAHPEHHLAAGGVGRDVGVAAFGAEVAPGEIQPLVVAGLLRRDRPLDGDVLVGRALVLSAQAEPTGGADGRGLAGPAAGDHVDRATGLVGVPDRDGQRTGAVRRRHAEHRDVHSGKELLAFFATHGHGHRVLPFVWVSLSVSVCLGPVVSRSLPPPAGVPDFSHTPVEGKRSWSSRTKRWAWCPPCAASATATRSRSTSSTYRT